jgi:hypothetical protein
MNEVFYKIRHKGSNLFFKPANNAKGIHLSAAGKVYQSRPSLKRMNGMMLTLGFGEIGGRYLFPQAHHPIEQEFHQKDWELLQFQTTHKVIPWSS